MKILSKVIATIISLVALGSNAGTIWDDGGSTYNWSEAANWNTPTGIPTTGANVSFGSSGTYVTTNINPTVGLITLNRSGSFSINGPGTITINTGVTTGRNNRTYTINAPLTFGNNNTWTNLNSGTALNINGAIDTATHNLTINNTGTVNLNSSINSTGNLVKSGSGTLNINTNNEKFSALTLSSGTLGLDFKTITVDGNATFTGGTLRLSVSSPTNNGQVIAGNTTTGNISLGNGTTFLSLSSSGYIAANTDRIWLLINNSNGSTTGYFNGLTEGTAMSIGGQTMYVRYGANYSTGDMFGGNDVMLCIPEPSSVITLLLGFSIFIFYYPKSNKPFVYS